MIDLTMHEERLQHAIDRAKERNILIPTFAQMQNPALIPENVKKALKNVGLWDVNPLNLFRISWHNEHSQDGQAQETGRLLRRIDRVLSGRRRQLRGEEKEK